MKKICFTSQTISSYHLTFKLFLAYFILFNIKNDLLCLMAFLFFISLYTSCILGRNFL